MRAALGCVETPRHHLPLSPLPLPLLHGQVTLHDCLACSGCVTTAETVLLETQSAQELSAKLAEARAATRGLAARMAAAAAVDAASSASPGPIVIISVSPQSSAALAGTRCLS